MKTLYKKINDTTIQCLACTHYCKIANGQTGVCGVRENNNGELELLVYGKARGMHIDPVEKKPLYHFLPGTNIFSFGTAGCNFRCQFCQNRDMSQAKAFPQILKGGTDLSPQGIVSYCKENNIPSIAYTYNEPTIFLEYALETMKLAHKEGIKNVRVSNGFMSPECLKKIKKYLDAINVDIKFFREESYSKICGSHLKPVLDNIQRFYKNNIWQELTTLVIPGYNDSEEELTEIAQFIYNISPDIPRHVSAFYGMYKMENVPSTPVETLIKAYNIGKKVGLKYVYIGNVPNNGYENTYCPKCNELLISRTGYEISDNTKKGPCPKCKELIPGVYQ